MASTISAGTSAGTAIAISGDTTGNLAFQTSAGTYTQTMPNATGTVMVSGNMPAFSAYRSTTQTFSSATWTKMQCQTEEFDTASAYDNATNYRFTPLVAGYYQVQVQVAFAFTGTSTTTGVAVYKNGSAAKYVQLPYASYIAGSMISGSALIYCNGTTDYLEAYVYSNGTSPEVSVSSGTASYFQAAMVRAA
jgi:hypothetical protein